MHHLFFLEGTNLFIDLVYEHKINTEKYYTFTKINELIKYSKIKIKECCIII